jgi:Ca-activated chloride channel family protein
LKKLIYITLLLLPALQPAAQYYIRGEVKDEKNQPLQNVKIYMHSNRLLYHSGVTGGFGITTPLLYDSLTFDLLGYETKSVKIKADVYQTITLKVLSANASRQKQKLLSLTHDMSEEPIRNVFLSEESYSSLAENEFINANKYPNTSFAVRVDKASYSNIRRFINQNSVVPPDAVRIEEMLNYFNFNYKEPVNNEILHVESQFTSCPWNLNHQLLFLNLSARKLNLDKVPPSNFVFLIDISGSMDLPNRLPLLKAAFQLLVKNLRAIDTVSIVIYGGSVGVWLQPTSGAEKQKIIKAIEELTAGGDTPGEAAIRTAYRVAKSTFLKNGNNRIILATDGDFNIGQTSEKDLEELIAQERQGGVYLTCLGVGMGNYKDSKIEVLARKGNGNFAYLDDIREGEKVLVSEFTQTLYTVANDVNLDMQFNPSMVKEYRLIGYDNKKNVLADTSVELEGGEIGSANGITAVFEIIRTEKNLLAPDAHNVLASLNISYRLPNDSSKKSKKFDCLQNFKEFNTITPDLRFAAAVTMFGLILRQSKYISNVSFDNITPIVTGSLNATDYLQNEFAGLVEKAKKIYLVKKKKKSFKYL